MTLRADVDAAADFLQKLYPEGPWALVAIEPDGPISGQTFAAGEVDALKRWVAHRNQTSNVYVHVNPVAGFDGPKATEAHVRQMRFCHVDADPRVQERCGTAWDQHEGDHHEGKECRRSPHEHLDAEVARIVAKLADPTTKVPEPTTIVASGGGVNVYWALAEPVTIEGQQAAADHFKRYNLQLERTFGGDHCHNLDRILRLAGTVNWPDKKKRAKGRMPTLSRVLLHKAENVYALSLFMAAPSEQGAADRGKVTVGAGIDVRISGNVQRLPSIDQLGDWLPKVRGGDAALPPDLRQTIAHGYDPNNPGKWGGDRSRAVFFVCCEMVRLGATDDQIYAVITDEDLGISCHILAQANPARAAERQIKRAREKAIDPALVELNDRYAVIRNFGGKCVVVEEVVDDEDTNRARLSAQGIDHFRNGFLNENVEVMVPDKAGNPQPKRVNKGQWWLTHRLSRKYDRVGFLPGREVPGVYNLWQGFAVLPLPGNAHDSYVKHVREVICRNDKRLFDFVWCWMARAVQRPELPAETALVLQAVQGTGKGTFVKWFGELWGRHFLTVSSSTHVTGNFNGHLANTCVLFADEAFYAGDPRNADILKRIITDTSLTIERKHIDVEWARNRIKLILASNHEHVVKIEADDRRYVYLAIDEAKKGDFAYFDVIDQDMRLPQHGGRGGICNLMHALMSTDISKFNHRAIPKTAGHLDQRMRSLGPEEDWWFEKLQDGFIIPGIPWSAPMPKSMLHDAYWAYAARVKVFRPANLMALGKFIKRVCPASLQNRRVMAQIRGDASPGPSEVVQPCFVLPDVRECRQRWEELYGGPFDWPNLDEEVTPMPRQRSVF